jgi:putative spermidine/putrescine transport system ATP-binding protein
VTGGRVRVLGTDLGLLSARPDGPAAVFVRPEHVRVAPDGVPAEVQESVFLGSVRRTRLETEDGASLWMEHDAGERYEPGARVAVTVLPEPVAATAA